MSDFNLSNIYLTSRYYEVVIYDSTFWGRSLFYFHYRFWYRLYDCNALFPRLLLCKEDQRGTEAAV